MMLNLALCEDEVTDRERIAALVKEWLRARNENAGFQLFASPYALLEAASHGAVFDIFLLDILMPEMTGITLGEHLRNRFAEPLLIYLTSSEDFYPDAFRLYAFQYICKPACRNNLFPVLDRALSRFEKQKGDIFTMKTTEGIVQIPLHSIVYAELLAHVCHIHLTDGQHLQSTYLRSGFDRFTAPLQQRRQFVKTHTSFVVNLDYAGRLTANTLFLTTGASVPVARSYSLQTQQRYMAYGLREEERK